MNQIIIWLMAIMFVEAVVEIEVESEIFIIIRDKISRIKFIGWLSWYLNGLLSCGYCLSVWVSMAVALFLPCGVIVELCSSTIIGRVISNHTPFIIVNYVLNVFVLHRLSNIVHELIHRWLKRIPYIMAFRDYEEKSKYLNLELESKGEGSDEYSSTDPEHIDKE